MGRSIVAKGASIKEAIHTALNLMEAKKDQVDIEIIETEKKGWMGIGSKPAVIRATYRDSSSENSSQNIEKPMDLLDRLVNDLQVVEQVDEFKSSELPESPL